jgi:hypothetical protein
VQLTAFCHRARERALAPAVADDESSQT